MLQTLQKNKSDPKVTHSDSQGPTPERPQVNKHDSQFGLWTLESLLGQFPVPLWEEDKRATTNVQNRFVQLFLLSFLLFCSH